MALLYTVLAFLPVAYVHDLTWPCLFVSALNLHGNIKGQPIDSTAQYERRDIDEKRILKRRDPAFPDSTLPYM